MRHANDRVSPPEAYSHAFRFRSSDQSAELDQRFDMLECLGFFNGKRQFKFDLRSFGKRLIRVYKRPVRGYVSCHEVQHLRLLACAGLYDLDTGREHQTESLQPSFFPHHIIAKPVHPFCFWNGKERAPN